MIALDTNVLVRYLVEDEPGQAALARRLIEDTLTRTEPGFVSLVVLVELAWVLRRLYGSSASKIAQIVSGLAASATIVVEDAASVIAAAAYAHADFADALIHEVGRAHGCARTVTFDHRFARLDGVSLLN